MALYKDEKRNTWFCKVNYLNEVGKLISHTKRGFKLKRDAINYESSFRCEQYEKQEIPVPVIPVVIVEPVKELLFQDLFVKYIENKRHEAEDYNVNKYIQVANRFFPSIMKKSMSKIKPSDYLECRNFIESQKAAVRYRNKAIFLLKSVSRFGFDYYELKDHARLLKVIPLKSTEFKEREVWTPDQFKLFIEHVDHVVYKSYFTFLYYSGVRRSEARAVEKKDIVDGCVSINKSMHQYKNEFKSLKTNSSRRKIQLNQHVLDMIAPLLERDGPLLFGDYEDLSSTSIQRYFSNGIKKCNQHLEGIGEKPIPKIRLHDMRHSHATFLINKGANIVAVSKRLGHSDINMTLKVYTHLLKENENQILILLENE
jgi:integrase